MYFENLNNDQKQNIALLIDAMEKQGITNKFAQAGILAVISKESNFKTENLVEKSYKFTSIDRIRKIFGSRVSSLSNQELTNLKRNDVDFFNTVYGCRYLTPCDKGFLYRGRGFNHITFLSNYQKASKYSGIDLVSNPEKLENPKVASKVAVAFFYDALKNNWNKRLASHYNAENINDFKSLNDSVLAFFHLNAGLGRPPLTMSDVDVTGGLSKAVSRVFGFYQLALNEIANKKILKRVILILILGSLIIGGFFLLRNILNSK